MFLNRQVENNNNNNDDEKKRKKKTMKSKNKCSTLGEMNDKKI